MAPGDTEDESQLAVDAPDAGGKAGGGGGAGGQKAGGQKAGGDHSKTGGDLHGRTGGAGDHSHEQTTPQGQGTEVQQPSSSKKESAEDLFRGFSFSNEDELGEGEIGNVDGVGCGLGYGRFTW